ncbi:Uncharacterised protein [Pseudomonas aeruginosa]|nr:Uncharacterised protein [Pseudomonas aeruginosa]VFT62995.1 Uncharacterised protein [Pseudomonas aeruginosa]
MVGVPFFDRCDCGPSLRTAWPIWRICKVRIIQGPSHSDSDSAVSTLRMPRRVRYWKTPKPL